MSSSRNPPIVSAQEPTSPGQSPLASADLPPREWVVAILGAINATRATDLMCDGTRAVEHALAAATQIAAHVKDLTDNFVRVPADADQAALMVLLGDLWLREHAPERLTNQARSADAAPVSPPIREDH